LSFIDSGHENRSAKKYSSGKREAKAGLPGFTSSFMSPRTVNAVWETKGKGTATSRASKIIARPGALFSNIQKRLRGKSNSCRPCSLNRRLALPMPHAGTRRRTCGTTFVFLISIHFRARELGNGRGIKAGTRVECSSRRVSKSFRAQCPAVSVKNLRIWRQAEPALPTL